MSSLEKPNESLGICCVFGLAGLLLFIAIFMDPIGSSPDTGMIDLGSSGSKWLLGGMGAAFALGGVWSLMRNKSLAQYQMSSALKCLTCERPPGACLRLQLQKRYATSRMR